MPDPALPADEWTILLQPAGVRDLARPEPWRASQQRADRRRAARAAGRGLHLPKGPAATVLATAILAGPPLAASAVAPAAASAATVSGTVSRGDTGARVRAVQEALGITADGVFGRQTERAVRSFQAGHGLEVDGVVGPQTSAALGAAPTDAAPDPAAAPAAPAAPAAGGSVQAAVDAALSKVGAPYASGGNGPDTFDCSGLTVWAMRQAGVSLPRTSFDQFGVGSSVDAGAIQAGDLVFFDTAGSGASHVGIATGPDTVVSATTHGVMSHAIHSGYWGDHYVGARRVG